MRYLATVGEKEFAVEVASAGERRYTVRLNGEARTVERRGTGVVAILSVDGRSLEATITREGSAAATARGERTYGVTIDGNDYPVRVLDPRRRGASSLGGRQDGPAEVRSIMPGRVVALLVRDGQEVREGQGVVVVEAMKMENEIPAPRTGRVKEIAVRPGDTVESGALLVTVE